MNLGLIKNVALGVGSALALLEHFGKSETVAAGNRQGQLQSAAQRYLKEIGNGMTIVKHNVRTLDDRMKHILGLANKYKSDPFIYKLGSEIVSIAGSRDVYAQCVALFVLVDKNVTYVKDIHGIDTYQSPIQTLALGRGDCDDFTILFAAIAMSMGIPVQAKVIRTSNAKTWSHIYPLLGIGNAWYPADATVEGFKFGMEAGGKLVADWVVYDAVTGNVVAKQRR